MCYTTVKNMVVNTHPLSVIKPPSDDMIEGMLYDRTNCYSVAGYDNIEPDGFDPDGYPSWLMALGIV